MADQDFKKLLIKLGINTDTWKTAVRDIRTTLSQVNVEQLATEKVRIATQQAQARVAQTTARASLIDAQRLTVEARTQAAQKNILIQQERLLQQQAASTVAQERAKTAEINRQTAAIRLQMAATRAAQTSSGGSTGGRAAGGSTASSGGAAAGFVTGFTSRLAGTLSFAILSAEGLGRVFEMLFEKVKRFIEESGPLQQLREQFEKLSSIKGYDAVQFIEQLRGATHNLVADTALYRTANLAMQSGLHISQGQIVELTQATVGLARSQGRDATQAVDALNRAFLTGRSMQLAYVTGLQRMQLQVVGMGRATDQLTQRQMQFDKVAQAVIARWKEFGEPALTFTERMKQVEVVSNRVFEAIARGTATSGGMKLFLNSLGDVMDRLGGAEGAAEKFGNSLGSIFGALGQVGKTAIEVVSGLAHGIGTVVEQSKQLSLAYSSPETALLIERFTTLRGLMTEIGSAAIMARSGFEQLAAVFQYIVDHPGPALNQMLAHSVSWLLRDAKGTTDVVDKLLDKYTDAADKGGGAALDSLKNKSQQIMLKTAADLADFQFQMAHPGYKAGVGAAPGAGGVVAPEETLAHRQALLQLQLQVEKAHSKEQMSLVKDNIQIEKDANQTAYDEGLKSFASYLNSRKRLLQLDHDARLKEIEQDRRDTIDEQKKTLGLQTESQRGMLSGIQTQLKGSTTPEGRQELLNQQTQIQQSMKFAEQQAALKIDLANTTARLATEAETRTNEQGRQQINEAAIKDARAAAQAKSAIELQLFDAKVKQEQEILKEELKDGTVSAHAYTEMLTVLYRQELDAYIQTESAKRDAAADTGKARVEYELNVAKKTQDINGQIAKLRRDDDTEAFNAAQKTLEARLKAIEILQKAKSVPGVQELIAQQTSPDRFLYQQGGNKQTGGQFSESKALEQSYIDITQQLIMNQTSQLANYAPGSAKWEDIITKITEYQQAVITATLATQSFGDVALKSLQGLVTAFDTLGGKFAKVAESAKGGLGLLSTVMQFPKISLQQGIGQTGTPIAPRAGPLSDLTGAPIEQPTAPFQAASSPMGGFVDSVKGFADLLSGKGAGSATDALQKFTTSLSASIETVGGFVQAMQGKGGPVGAGLSGLVSGGSLGGGLGSAIGSIGNLGALAGPIGSIVGSAIGMVGGIISGAKQAAANRIIDQAQKNFNEILRQYSLQTDTLQQTIAQLQVQQAAVAQEIASAGKKIDTTQAQAALQQMQQQIAQLQAQQLQIMQTFQDNLAILNAPDAFQPMLTQIDQIIQKYQQYIDAGGSVATANQFLTQSFAQFTTQGLATLNTDQQQAINDALNYNNLLIQRQNLIDQTNNQIQNLLTTGAATRQETRAMSVGYQIGQLQQARDQQLEQLNMEISTAGYKLSVEQQIFNLSTDRITLETQLVALQNAQTDKAMQQIQALMQVLAVMRGGGTGLAGTLQSAVTGTAPNTVNAAILAALLSALGLTGASNPSASAGTLSIEDLLSELYNQRAAYGQGGFAQDTASAF